MKTKSPKEKIRAICDRLGREYGPVEPPPQGPVLDELVAVILSQNTSDTNSGPAFDELKRQFPKWEDVRRAPLAKVIAAIRRAGLANQKAPRIRHVLDCIHRERGELSLEFLRDWPPAKAAEYLASFPGVGPKTVGCTLLFACRMPVLPVDTHVHRVSVRLGLIGAKVNAAHAHELLSKMVPPGRVLDFHIQLIRHGRACCTASKPRCADCRLWDLCPFGQKHVR